MILTRRLGESVKIGDEITVTVLGIKGNQLCLGFASTLGRGGKSENIRLVRAGRAPADPVRSIGTDGLR